VWGEQYYWTRLTLRSRRASSILPVLKSEGSEKINSRDQSKLRRGEGKRRRQRGGDRIKEGSLLVACLLERDEGTWCLCGGG